MRLSFKLLFLSVFIVIMGLISGCASTGSKLYTYRSVAAPGKEWRGYQELPVYMDVSFSSKEKQDLKKTVNEWNYALNGYLKLTVAKDFDKEDPKTLDLVKQIKQSHQGYLILKLKHDDPIIEDIIDEDDGTLAFVNDIGHYGHFMFVLQDRIGTRDLHVITLHEFGHLMGAWHVAGTLMNPSYGNNSAPCIDKITMLQVANEWKLDLNKLNYCIIPNFE